MLMITPSSKEIQIPFEYAGIIPISLATEKRNCVFLSVGNSVIIFRCNLLLFYNIFIVNRNHAVVFTFKIFPSKDISTPFTEDMESTLPFTLL